MRKLGIAVLFVVVMAGVVAALYLQVREKQEARVELPADEVSAAPEQPPGPRYPIPDASSPASPVEGDSQALPGQPLLEREEPPEPVPALNESDPTLNETVRETFGAELQALLRLDEVARRLVVSVDNLTATKLPRRQLLVKPVPGQFMASGEGDALQIHPDNAARYTPFVEAATRVGPERVYAIYTRFYPLLQEAYAELGYPNAYFNDRVVEVIDHLLATPEITEPVLLVRPHVFYQYADPQLEALSAGQKTLIRMGATNAEQVRLWLRGLRENLTRHAVDPDARPEADGARL